MSRYGSRSRREPIPCHRAVSLALRFRGKAASATLIPTFSGNYMTALTAVFGTTISPCLFFWQASQEVEEQLAAPDEKPLKLDPEQEAAQLERMRTDTYVGMAFSNLIAFFIILDTGATLHLHGLTDIQSATQAAESLRPLAGQFAFLLFSIGISATGLLAIPALAASGAYAWRKPLNGLSLSIANSIRRRVPPNSQRVHPPGCGAYFSLRSIP